MFPLNLVAFPGESINLHIFEHRYRQLIHEADAYGVTFGIPCLYKDKIQDECPEMQLEEIVKRYDDGKMDVTVKCIGLVKILDFHKKSPDKLYPIGEVEKLDYCFKTDDDKIAHMISLAKELYRLLNITNVSLELLGISKLSKIIHKIGLSFDQELELQKLLSDREKTDFIINHLELFLPTVRRTEEIKTKAALNGHFKHLTPLF